MKTDHVLIAIGLAGCLVVLWYVTRDTSEPAARRAPEVTPTGSTSSSSTALQTATRLTPAEGARRMLGGSGSTTTAIQTPLVAVNYLAQAPTSDGADSARRYV